MLCIAVMFICSMVLPTGAVLAAQQPANIHLPHVIRNVETLTSAPSENHKVLDAEGPWRWISDAAAAKQMEQVKEVEHEMQEKVLQCGSTWRRTKRRGSPQSVTKFFLIGRGAQDAVELLVKLLARNKALIPAQLAPVCGFTICKETNTCAGVDSNSRSSSPIGLSARCGWRVISVNGTGLVYSDGRAHDLLALESVALSEMQRKDAGLLIVGQAGSDSISLSPAVSRKLHELLSDSSLPAVIAIDDEFFGIYNIDATALEIILE